MTGDALTVLHSVNRRHATKRITRTKAGEIKNRSYDNERYFRVEIVAVADFAGLCAALDRLAPDPFAFIIRGEPLPDINFAHTRRLLHPDNKIGDRATFTAAARHWFAVDIDHIAAPPATDPAFDPDGCVEYLISRLPGELADARCWWQFTSSQSLPGGEGTLAARLWFWSSERLDDAELVRWATVANRESKLIDVSLYRAVQAHYIARPVFAGMADPLPRRSGVRPGLDDAVSLVIPPPDPKNPEMVSGQGYEPGQGVAAYFAHIGGGQGFRGPIVKAIASYIAIYGSKADCGPLKAAIKKAIDGADAGGRSAGQIERYRSDEHLDDLIGWICDHHGNQPPKGFVGEPPPWVLELQPPPAEPSEGEEGDVDEDEGIGPLPAEFSTEALALQFSAQHRDDWRYVPLWSKWLQWTAVRWQAEDTLRAFDLARAICRRNSAIADADPFCSDKLAREIASASMVAGVERLARADRRHATLFSQWNADRWVFNQPPAEGNRR